MTAYKCCKRPSSDILSFQTETSASLPLTCLARADTGTCGSTTTETARYAPLLLTFMTLDMSTLQGIIFVVDSSDRLRMVVAKDELDMLLQVL